VFAYGVQVHVKLVRLIVAFFQRNGRHLASCECENSLAVYEEVLA
jgi:hypothetical protein